MDPGECFEVFTIVIHSFKLIFRKTCCNNFVGIFVQMIEKKYLMLFCYENR